MIEYVSYCRETIHFVIGNMLKIKMITRETICCNFNGIEIVVDENSTFTSIYRNWENNKTTLTITDIFIKEGNKNG